MRSLKGDLACHHRLDGERELGRRRCHHIRRIPGTDLIRQQALSGPLLADERVDGLQIFGRTSVEAVAHRLWRLRDDVRLHRTNVDGMLRRQFATRR